MDKKVESEHKDILNESDILFGRNAVTEMLKGSGRVDTLYIADADDRALGYLAALARERGAVVKVVHPSKLQKMCGSERHQGVAAQCSLCEYRTLDELFDLALASEKPPFFVVVDGVEDPHNLGAIIRTAVCAGAHGVIIPERRGCTITAAVYRASAGGCAHIPVARVGNLANAIRDIKQRGVFCYCAEADGELCYEKDLTGAAALVVGSEGYGVSRLVRELCDATIRLPMYGALGSLNASVAAGILMYEFVRQNKGKESAQHE